MSMFNEKVRLDGWRFSRINLRPRDEVARKSWKNLELVSCAVCYLSMSSKYGKKIDFFICKTDSFDLVCIISIKVPQYSIWVETVYKAIR